jgi:transposase
MSRIRQHYDEFRKNAVKLSYATTKPIKEFCEALGVHHSLIHRWRKTYTANGGKSKVAEQQDQLRKLLLELAELKMENEMLKEAAAYFAKNLK